METDHSSLAVIKFKPPFIKWANSYNPYGMEHSKEFFAENPIAVVIPLYTFKLDARRYINEVWEDIFREALKWWNPNEVNWPRRLTRKMFGLWFQVTFVPTVMYWNEEQ